MIPAAFEYTAPRSLREATRLLAELGPDAKLLAGGHSLLPAMKLRLARPAHLVDLRHLDELRAIGKEKKELRIGALATHAEIASSRTVARACPLLQQTAAAIGDIQVRNSGTIGGSIAHADPAADYPAALLALDAVVKLNSAGRSRRVKASDFFLHLFTTALDPTEIVTEIRIPLLAGSSGAYLKLRQPASGFAIVAAAALVKVRSDKFQQVRLAFNGVAPAAYRASSVEEALDGASVRGRHLDKACEAAADGVELMEDLHAGQEYRRRMASVFGKRAIQAAVRSS